MLSNLVFKPRKVGTQLVKIGLAVSDCRSSIVKILEILTKNVKIRVVKNKVLMKNHFLCVTHSAIENEAV